MTAAVPSWISEQAQLALRAYADAPQPELPCHDDSAGWTDFVHGMRAALEQALGARAAQWSTRVELHCLDLNGVPVYRARPRSLAAGQRHVVVLHMHGGGFALGGGPATRAMAMMAADQLGLLTFAPDYRLAPEHPFPAAVDDCLASYRWLLNRFGPQQIVAHGHSAGANLAAAVLLRARDQGLPMPLGAALLSPEADLTEIGDSFDTVGRVRYLSQFVEWYAGTHDRTDAYLSPVYGDLSHFPPTFVQSGTRDLFLSNSVRFHRALRRAGVSAQLHVWEAMPHAGFSGSAPEDREVDDEVKRFIANLIEADRLAKPRRA